MCHLFETSDADSMGRPHKDIMARHGAIVRILQAIQTSNGNRVGEMLLDLSRVTAHGTVKVARSPRAMCVAWRRWLGGKSIPPLLELARVVEHAKTHGWLLSVTAEDDLRCSRWLVRIARNAGVPKPWNKNRPLGKNQPTGAHHRFAWVAKLAFVREITDTVLQELGVPNPFEVAQRRLIPRGDEVMTAFRAIMNEIACQIVEGIHHGRSDPDSNFETVIPEPEIDEDVRLHQSIYESDNRWPIMLREIGDDLAKIFTGAARQVEIGGDPTLVTSNARESLLALVQPTRVPQWCGSP